MIVPYFNVFLVDKFQFSDKLLGTIFAVSSLMVGLATFIGPRLVGRMGGKIRMIVFSQAVSLVFLVMLGFSPYPWLAVIGFLIRGMLMNMAAPLFDAYSMERTTENEQGTINSIRNLAWNVGWAVGPYISGVIQQYYGFSPIFLVTLILYAVWDPADLDIFWQAENPCSRRFCCIKHCSIMEIDHSQEFSDSSTIEAMGTLFLVATPIGNLEDISARALRILAEVQLIAVEDTRQTRKLLSHYKISTRTTSYYEYNKISKLDIILGMLEVGDVALVSDAGTPALNDPGYELVQAALQAGHNVSPIPGASAPLAALVVSGLPTDSFVYLGYLPRKSAERRKFIQEVENLPYTLICPGNSSPSPGITF